MKSTRKRQRLERTHTPPPPAAAAHYSQANQPAPADASSSDADPPAATRQRTSTPAAAAANDRSLPAAAASSSASSSSATPEQEEQGRASAAPTLVGGAPPVSTSAAVATVAAAAGGSSSSHRAEAEFDTTRRLLPSGLGPRSACYLHGLASIEVQSIMHCLDSKSLIALGRCSRRLHSDADTDFAWKYQSQLQVRLDERSPPTIGEELHRSLAGRLPIRAHVVALGVSTVKCLNGLHHLTSLDLEDQFRIPADRESHKDSFDFLREVRSLDVDSTLLQNFSASTTFPRLEVLKVRGGLFDRVPRQFTQLHTLHLTKCRSIGATLILSDVRELKPYEIFSLAQKTRAVINAFEPLKALTQVRVRDANVVRQVLTQPAVRAYFASRMPPVEVLCEDTTVSPSGQ